MDLGFNIVTVSDILAMIGNIPKISRRDGCAKVAVAAETRG